MLIPSSGSCTFLRASTTCSLSASGSAAAPFSLPAAPGTSPTSPRAAGSSSGISSRASFTSAIPGSIVGTDGRPAVGAPPPRLPPCALGADMKVLIVDDHPVTRDGLRSALSTSDEGEIVGEAATGEEAVQLVKELAPEVVFMDVRLPRMTGIE